MWALDNLTCHKSVYATWRSHRWPECLLDLGQLQTVQDACAGNVGRSDVIWAFTASVPTRGYPTVTCFLETKKCKSQLSTGYKEAGEDKNRVCVSINSIPSRGQSLPVESWALIAGHP